MGGWKTKHTRSQHMESSITQHWTVLKGVFVTDITIFIAMFFESASSIDFSKLTKDFSTVK